MNVFGIGLNKTGTISFHEALVTLGFRSLHWGGAPVRAAIVRAMEDGRPMLEYLPGYDAFSDITILTENFQILDRQYPRSKFVLTTRDLDTWLESRRHHVEKNVANKAEGLYDGLFLTVDYVGWRRLYTEHHARVYEHFAGRRDDLLVMNVIAGDGYDVLCPFLGRRPPDDAFPWRNPGVTRPSGQVLDRDTRRGTRVVVGQPPGSDGASPPAPPVCSERPLSDGTTQNFTCPDSMALMST